MYTFWKFLCFKLSFLPAYDSNRILLTTRPFPPLPSGFLRLCLCNCCVVLWLFCFEISGQRLNITWVRAVHPRDIQFIFRDPRLGMPEVEDVHSGDAQFIGCIRSPARACLNSRVFPLWTSHIRTFLFSLCTSVFHPFLLLLPLCMFTFYPSVIWGLSICFVFHCL